MSFVDPVHVGGVLVITVLVCAASSSTASAIARERLGDVETFFHANLQRAHNAGLIEPAIKPAVMAEILLGTVLAIRVFARLDPDRSRLRRLADHALVHLSANKKAARR